MASPIKNDITKDIADHKHAPALNIFVESYLDTSTQKTHGSPLCDMLLSAGRPNFPPLLLAICNLSNRDQTWRACHTLTNKVD